MSYTFNRKLKIVLSVSFLFFFVGLTQNGFAQSTTKSTNIITVNDKKYYLHKVSHAQSLYGISKIYGVDMNTLIKENPGATKGVVVGQELRIPIATDSSVTTNQTTTEATPTPTTTSINGKKYALHKVTLDEITYGISAIAKTYNVSVNDIINENPAVTKGIMVGQELKIPMEAEATTTPSTTVTNSSSDTPDLLSLVDDAPTKKEKEYVTGTFKSTRNINFHTVEVLGKRCLDFRISHRFGNLNSGANNAWGLDGPANLMLSLEYSHDGRWMVGISRCIQNKTAEAFVKVKIFRQVKHGWPFTVTYFGGLYHTSVMQNAGVPVEYYRSVGDRVSYVNQALFASKITPWLSIQIGYAWVHYNLVDGQTPNTNSGYSYHLSNNDCHVLTGVIRAKYNKRQAIIFEYAYRLNTNYASIGSKYYNSMGIGWEIETGGHVFQLFLTNSSGIMENDYLMTTNTSWRTSGIRLGFNITRIFAIGKQSKSAW